MKKVFKKTLALAVSTLLVGALLVPFLATAAQVTNDTLNQNAPQVNSSGKAVWSASDGTSDNDTEIYLWNGSSVVQLTSNSEADASPQINDNGAVAWLGTDSAANGSDNEIWYNSTGASSGNTRLTTDPDANDDDGAPQITVNSAGANIVAWVRPEEALDGVDDEIYTSTNGAAAAFLTADAAGGGTTNNDAAVQAAGNYLIWTKTDGTRRDVYLSNNLAASSQLTSNNASSIDESSTVVDSTGKAAWFSGIGTVAAGYTTDPEIQYYNGTTVSAITDNGSTETSLGISNGQIVWATNAEIYFNPSPASGAAATKRLTTNGMDDDAPVVSNGQVVWEGDRRDPYPTAAADPNNEDYDIFLYTASDGTTYQVNDDKENQVSPDINSGKVAWLGFDGSDDEVFTDTVLSSSLSLKAKPTTVKKGKATTLSGTLKNSAGQAISNAKVAIKAGNSTVKTVKTNSKGQFKTKVKPKKTTTYKAVFSGKGTNLKKTSKTVKVKVKK